MKRRARRALILLAGGLCFIAAFVLWDRYGPRPAPPPLAPLEGRIDRIVIDKSDRRLTVYNNDVALRSYDVALGFAPEGTKREEGEEGEEGDGRTPEGIYAIDRRNAQSAYHLSLGIDYPRPEDVAQAEARGVSPGGDIFVHGQPNGLGRLGRLPGDWTAGCVALSDAEMTELWRITPIGTQVVIQP